MIKMIATDIDGTILPYHGEFSQKTKDCIKRLNDSGIKVILVTGRMHSSATPLAAQLGLNLPIISYQGGLIKDMSGKTLFQTELNSDVAKEIINWGRKNNVHLNLYIDDKLYVEQDDEIIKYYIQGKFVDYTVCSFDDLEIKNVNKLLAIDIHDADRVTSWVDILKEKYPDLYIVKSTPYFCEIGSKDAKKSLGVEFLCKMWGIDKSEVMAIGDQNNDIDLIQAGGIGIAMENGTPELKQVADYITNSVENDGFVSAVEKFIFSAV
ncbi:HAD family hydrolase [bacterium]|nr:HAD family hydrolase [bacterium]